MQLMSVQDIGPRDLARAGGKAVGLARLVARGLPVPPAVVVPAAAFVAHLRAHGLMERARRGGGPELQAAVMRGRMDPELAGALRREAAHLGAQLAVRSSAVDEDGAGASHAGQFETVLCVRPGDETERAVLRCWASAFSGRVSAYRGRLRGGARALPEMAVVVQAMVAPRCAGVMFTTSPLTGTWREMTVEAAWGLGEAVVSGRVVPDFYQVRRPRRLPGPVQPRPLERVLARVRLVVERDEIRPQTRQWVRGASGPEEVAVPPARVEAPKLRHAELLRLCRLGLRVERALGAPQDIEWAQDERGRFFLLQARPITTGGKVRRAGKAVWTRRFVGERWTEPATPLGWSIMRDLLHWFIAYPETSRRLLGGEAPSRLVRFAPYFNVTVFRHLAFKAPGAAPPRFMVELLPGDEERGWLRARAMAPDLRMYRSILQETVKERRWRRFRWNPFTNWRAWDAYERALGPALDRLPDVQRQSDALACADACAELARDYVRVHICSLLFANIWFEAAQALLESRGVDPGPVLRPYAETWTTRTNGALWDVGRGLAPMGAFLRVHGHRAASSWELFSPRWAETPDLVAELARVAADGPDPRLAARLRIDAADRTVAALPMGLRAVVTLTRRYLQLREDQRYHFDRVLFRWKAAWLSLEAHTGLQLRFLEAAEVRALLDGLLARDQAVSLIERRSAAYDAETVRRADGDEPPAFLVGDEAVEAGEGSAGRLQGMGISAGVVTGPVRVLRSLADAGQLRPGEILVTRATDPGWTPLFLLAGGLVMELGGMLSHGAVVAREYGLPAVVNVEDATRRLRDGQVVTVDGARGTVFVR